MAASTSFTNKDILSKDRQKMGATNRALSTSGRIPKDQTVQKDDPLVATGVVQIQAQPNNEVEIADAPQNKRCHPNDNSLMDQPAVKRTRMDIDSIQTENISLAHSTSEAQPKTQLPPMTTLDNIPHNTPDVFRDMLEQYDTQIINIASNTAMESKTTRILAHLSRFSFSIFPPKYPLVVLVGKASVANKLIGIIEIAKRELAKEGHKWYQYNILTSITEEHKIKDQKSADIPVNDKETEDSDFEMMKTPLERDINSRPKIRAVPIISIGLTRVRIDALRNAYGEQTNATS